MAHLRFHVDQSMRNPARLTYNLQSKARTKGYGFAVFSKLFKIYSCSTLAERHSMYFSEEQLINSCYEVFLPQMKINVVAEGAHG